MKITIINNQGKILEEVDFILTVSIEVLEGNRDAILVIDPKDAAQAVGMRVEAAIEFMLREGQLEAGM